MIPGENRTFLLQIGDTLTVNASSGTASVVQVASGVEPGSPVNVSNNTQSFGPFDDIRQYRVFVTAGIFVDVNTTRSAVVRDRPYRVTVTTRKPSTIIVPAGNTLEIVSANGAGFYTPADAFTPVIFFNGSTAIVGPFSEIRRFTIYATSGAIVATTSWASDPVVIPPAPIGAMFMRNVFFTTPFFGV